MSGTLGGEWQPASDRANDFGCRPREGRTDPMGHPVALSKAAWRAASRRWMHPIVPLPRLVPKAVAYRPTSICQSTARTRPTHVGRQGCRRVARERRMLQPRIHQNPYHANPVRGQVL